VHIPVLLERVVERVRPGALAVDCTLGDGGHAVAMRRRGATVIGIDLDPAAARDDLEFHRTNFAALPAVLAGRHADFVLADLGMASPQIDDPERGFSYRKNGPLDMRMDPTRGKTAADLVNSMSEEALAAALLELGDEEDAAKIAKLIVERRPLRTTHELMALVCKVRDFTLKRAEGAKLHPAARTFQALRILVNRELANLDRLLAVLPECLAPGGTAVIISYHSGEDRRVKKAFRDFPESGGPIVADEAERRKNPRARSAKLRWARLSAR